MTPEDKARTLELLLSASGVHLQAANDLSCFDGAYVYTSPGSLYQVLLNIFKDSEGFL